MNKYLPAIEPSKKDHPLRKDIRLLGKILGQTIKSQEGKRTYDLVERTRKYSVAFQKTVTIYPRKTREYPQQFELVSNKRSYSGLLLFFTARKYC